MAKTVIHRLPCCQNIIDKLPGVWAGICWTVSSHFLFSFSFRLTAKAVAVLLPILGSSWIFGILAVNAHALVFQYIFAIFNSLQVSTQWESLWLPNCCWDPINGSLVMFSHACVYWIFSVFLPLSFKSVLTIQCWQLFSLCEQNFYCTP